MLEIEASKKINEVSVVKIMLILSIFNWNLIPKDWIQSNPKKCIWLKYGFAESKNISINVTINPVRKLVKDLTTKYFWIFDENSLVEKQEPELYRFKLNDELILTITSKEQGYIAIRGKEINDDLINKYSQILKELEFSPYKNVK